jgi:hypothetical protein
MITLPYDDQFQMDTSSYVPSVSNAPPTNYGSYMTMAGGGFTAASQYMAGKDSASLLRANAAIAGMEGRGENQAGAETAELYRQHLQQRVGTQAASIGGSNLTTSGSALRSLETTSMLGAQDIARIRTNAARKAWGFDVTQQGDQVRAQNASNAGTNAAIGSLITSGARAYGMWAGV